MLRHALLNCSSRQARDGIFYFKSNCCNKRYPQNGSPMGSYSRRLANYRRTILLQRTDGRTDATLYRCTDGKSSEPNPC